MTKEKISNTLARQRLSKKIGTKKLVDLENIILKGSRTDEPIIESSARDRLRKKLGKKELEQIESKLLAGEM